MGTLDKNTKFKSIYRVSDAQPNWAQTDPSQPDYIKNRDMAQEVRPIHINGEPFLSSDPDSGAVNLVAGNNIILTTKGNNIVIQSTGGGEGGPTATYLEGEGIDIVQNEFGQFVIALEENAIKDKHINSISMDKVVQNKENIFILNGGNANGEYN
jgi:hypothetical protein